MKINLDEKILETLLPVTRGEKDIEETANLLIIVGLQKSVEDGFKGLNEKEVENLMNSYTLQCLTKDILRVLRGLNGD